MDDLINFTDKLFDAIWQFICKYYLRALFFLAASLGAYLLFLVFLYFIRTTQGAGLEYQVLQTAQGTFAFLVMVFCGGFFLFGLFHSFDIVEKIIKKIGSTD